MSTTVTTTKRSGQPRPCSVCGEPLKSRRPVCSACDPPKRSSVRTLYYAIVRLVSKQEPFLGRRDKASREKCERIFKQREILGARFDAASKGWTTTRSNWRPPTPETICLTSTSDGCWYAEHGGKSYPLCARRVFQA